jgi:hypothetical protein
VRLRRGGERSVQTNARWTYGDTTSTEVCVHYPPDFRVSHIVITATQRHRTLEKRMCAPVLKVSIHLFTGSLRLSYTADEQTFPSYRTVALSVSQANNTSYSCGHGRIIISVHTVVLLLQDFLFQTAYHTTPTCSRSCDKLCSFHPSSHTCSLHFLSV